MKKSTLKKPKKIKKTKGVPLAVFSVTGGVCLLERVEEKSTNSLHLSWSTDGLNFSTDHRKVSIKFSSGKGEKIKDCDNFRVSSTSNGFIMTYVRIAKTKDKEVIVVARSKDLYEWSIKSEIIRGDSNHSIIIYSKLLDLFLLYKDGLFIKSQSTRSLSFWKERSSLILTSRHGMFDEGQLEIVGCIETKEGLLLIYDASVKEDKQHLLQIGGVLFDVNNPNRILWRSESPLWQGVVETKNKKSLIVPVGFINLNGTFMVYWLAGDGSMVFSTFPSLFENREIYQHKILKRFDRNPIITARLDHDWEIQGTFNPAVFQDDDGVLHLFYRAVGNDGISRIGYAQSIDGLSITKRLPHPVFEPSLGFGMPDVKEVRGPIGYYPSYYTSGGGWGGSEDPRIVKIGDRIYMIYVAFEGWNSIRIALTYISVSNFKKGRWIWKKPALISPPNKINKNWLLFPEKINGKYAILHSITPEIEIEAIEDMDNIGIISSNRPGGPQPGREGFFDNRVRGAGPPPLRTELGWLLLYHATDKKEPHKYKLGAMVLDLNNPTKILYRSAHPILSPDMHYENEGKPGVVYASGAVIKGDDLYVYYGGGDKVVCVAMTPLKEFLDYLVTGKPDYYELKKVI